MKSMKKSLLVAALCVLTIAGSYSFIISEQINFKLIDLDNVSRYNEDRIAFQHIQFDVPADKISSIDNSVACLLIIKDNYMYLMKDGYDDYKDVLTKRRLLDMENKIIKNKDLWENEIANKPDFIQITERRIELMKKIDQMKGRSAADSGKKEGAAGATPAGEKDKSAGKSGEGFVANNFGKLYLNVRNEFIKRHMEICRDLMINRALSGLYVERKPLPKKAQVGVGDEPTKYSTKLWAKSNDETQYFAEDADGDGITETFTVNIPDGFNWGYLSGPNIIFIYKNKSKELQDLIGTLTNDAYFGTKEEAETIKTNMKYFFPKDDDPAKIRDWIDRIFVPTFDKEEESKKR